MLTFYTQEKTQLCCVSKTAFVAIAFSRLEQPAKLILFVTLIGNWLLFQHVSILPDFRTFSTVFFFLMKQNKNINKMRAQLAGLILSNLFPKGIMNNIL